MARSSGWTDLVYRPLAAPWAPALGLFSFAGASAPAAERIEAGWGAMDGERLCGAVLEERAGPAAMLHGPVVVAPSGAPADAALDVAGRLLGEALAHAPTAGIDTVFTRPQGLDQVWVRLGFIPVPEAELPPALQGRPGLGLYGWRGGSAIWSMAGRGVPRPRAASRR